MKFNQVFLPILTGSLLAAALEARALDVVITGSTAFRSITFDRVKALFDGTPQQAGDFVNGPGTYSGTMSNQTSLGSTPVNVRMSFSGSGTGMAAVDSQTPLLTIDPNGNNNTTLAADIALSDVYPESANPSLAGADFDQYIIGVIPFAWVCNNAMAGVTNITREQALLLMGASGPGGMPASFLGMTGIASSNVVYLTGRDSGSGTRITTQKNIGYTGTSPLLWAYVSGSYVLTNGMTSGGFERSTIANGPYAIGYLGLADALAIASSSFTITYEGFLPTVANVQTGKYPMWGYEHLVNKTGILSSQKAAVRDALVAAITNQGYQTTNTLYTANFVDLANMHVRRGSDGGNISSTDF